MILERSEALVHVQATVASGINQAVLLDYLKYEGYYSLRDGWIALHYPKCPSVRSNMQGIVGAGD
jgi:hypothetical protein